MHDIKARLIFDNDGSEYYLGFVKYYDGDMYLYTEHTQIRRCNEVDAIYDAKKMSEDH